MTIDEGEAASVELVRLMFGKDVLASEREALRRDLLKYCERDTEVMVALSFVLSAMAKPRLA